MMVVYHNALPELPVPKGYAVAFGGVLPVAQGNKIKPRNWKFLGSGVRRLWSEALQRRPSVSDG